MHKHKKLPHLDLKGYYQFITFRTKDSLSSYLKRIYNMQIENHKKQYIVDRYLDSSNDGAYFYKEAIDIFKNVLEAKDGIYYTIIAYTVMPNHIHLLLKQKESLNKIVRYIKAKSAIELNRFLKRKGIFWAEGYYDKAIRDEKHFLKVYEYILNNPLKAGLNPKIIT